jgi:hypothetical protein
VHAEQIFSRSEKAKCSAPDILAAHASTDGTSRIIDEVSVHVLNPYASTKASVLPSPPLLAAGRSWMSEPAGA